MILLSACGCQTSRRAMVPPPPPPVMAMVLEPSAAALPVAFHHISHSYSPPARDFSFDSPGHSGWYSSNYCQTVTLGFTVPAGTWGVWWNWRPEGQQPLPNAYGSSGQPWTLVNGTNVSGPTNVTMNIPICPAETAYFQLRKATP